jgi:hypothetical protein
VDIEVLGSDPDPPVSPAHRRLRRTVRRVAQRYADADARQRRTALVLATVLLAAAGLAVLRTGPLTTGGSAGRSAWTVGGAPPYDALPGRVPIPAPSLVSEDGRVVEGRLPIFELATTEATARRAVELVLGRYCRTVGAQTVRFAPGVGWTNRIAVVTDARSGQFVAALTLWWDRPWPDSAGSYRWRGTIEQLRTCR